MAQCANNIRNDVGTEFNYHLGGNFYAETLTTTQNVHLLKYEQTYDDINEWPYMMDTENKIALTTEEFDTYIANIDKIEKALPELSILKPCYLWDDHRFGEGTLVCSECNPNGCW